MSKLGGLGVIDAFDRSQSDKERFTSAEPTEKFEQVRPLVARISVAEIGLLAWYGWSLWRSKWISDDGYIYLTYVQNLTENGWGPALNPGERVEAFTSTAWYGLLSVLNWARPEFLADLRQAVLVLSMVLSLAAMSIWVQIENRAAAQRSTTRRDRASFEPPISAQHRVNLPLAALVGWYPLQSFGTSGLETPLQILLTMLVVWFVWSDWDNRWAVGAIAGILPLVRPELGLVSLMLLGRHSWRSRSFSSTAAAVGVFAGINLTSVIIRIAIFAQLLPNTYYAKTNTGHGFESGLEYLQDALIPYGLQWVILAAAGVILVPLLRRDEARLGAAHGRQAWLFASAALLILYVVIIGGDFMHARFLLTPVLLVAGVFSGLGSRLFWGGAGEVDERRRAILSAMTVLAVLIAASITIPLQHRAEGKPEFFGDIADEQRFYDWHSPALHDWDQDELHWWSYQGTSLSRLSFDLDTEIGIARDNIGQFTYFAQAQGGRIYTYDSLGLTRLDVARLDMPSVGRVGHAKRAPAVLIATNPRVDIGPPLYFDGWSDHAQFRLDGVTYTVVNPEFFDLLVEGGIISTERDNAFRSWMMEELHGPQVDRNFVTFLAMRYTRNDEVLARVRELSELDESSEWRRWLEDTAGQRELLQPDGCVGFSFFSCIRTAFDRHSVEPMPFLPDEPDWVPNP